MRKLADLENKLGGKRPEELTRENDKLKRDLADRDREIEKLKKKIQELEAALAQLK